MQYLSKTAFLSEFKLEKYTQYYWYENQSKKKQNNV